MQELQGKTCWRSKRIRDFIFLKSQNNTFLQELAEYKDDMGNFDINDIKLLLKCTSLENNDVFNIQTERSSNKELLKNKLSDIYTMKRSFDLDSYLTLNTSNPYAVREVSKDLYDYLMNVNKKILRRKKKNRKQAESEENPKKLGFTSLSNLKLLRISKQKNQTYDQDRLFNTTQQTDGEDLDVFSKSYYCQMALPFQTETPLKNFNEQIKKLRSSKESQTLSTINSEKNRYENVGNGNSFEKKKINKYFNYQKPDINFGLSQQRPKFLEEISQIQDNNNLPLKFIAKLIKNNENRKLIRLKNINREKFIQQKKKAAKTDLDNNTK